MAQDNQSNTPTTHNSLADSPIGKIRDVSITEEMEKSYLDYAMSVIVARALPDVRDGLKPVQRRILYAMKGLGLSSISPYKKSARIVGEVIGKYHPHGDQAVYDAMVRLAQDFSLRYPMVQGQGNFGSIDGDPPAHMRYTEARLTKIAAEMLVHLDKNTVNFNENFDGSETEPEVLPAKLPYLLANGVDGIAVGMATKIPPHNLGEIIDALLFILANSKLTNYPDLAALTEEDPDLSARYATFFEQYDQDAPYFRKPKVQHFKLDASEIDVDQLMEFIPGPDVPTGGEIYYRKAIHETYNTGKGRILIRAKTNIAETKQGKMQIEITELPYQQNKAVLIAQIANLAKEGKIDSISDLRDESDRKGMKIVVELKRGANPQRTLNLLYKYTPMQQNFHVNMVALENNTPRLMPLKAILLAHLKHRQEVTVRRISHELINALHRGHILEGLKIALDNLDAVIETIRKSKDADVARLNLMKNFKLTEIQANAILEMQLRRLAALEREKILNEYEEVLSTIRNYEQILAEPKQVIAIIREELEELKNNHVDPRRTKVYKGQPGEISDEELIKKEETILLLSRGGYIKRVSPQSFRTQGRGGKGVSGGKLKEEDVIQLVKYANTHDVALFFTNKGRVFSKRVWEVPEASRTSRGTPIVNFVGVDQDETVTNILTLTNQHDE